MMHRQSKMRGSASLGGIAAFGIALLAAGAVSAYEYTPTATGGFRSVASFETNSTGNRATIYVTHAFTNTNGTHVLNFSKATTVDVLVVGGGGGGGTGGGGGGAGAVVYQTSLSFAAGDYTITVGAGGASDRAGSPSSIVGGDVSISAQGGGKGGSINNNGSNGASGGGGGVVVSSYQWTSTTSGGAATDENGHAGGGGAKASTAGGGGGAGGPGYDYNDAEWPGCGGPGVTNWITGSAVVYGGGGGGSRATSAVKCYGGSDIGGRGGAGAGNPGEDGKENTGSGGGGGYALYNNTSVARGAGGMGGSGVVIVRYAETVPLHGMDDNSGDSCVKSGDYYIHTYTTVDVTNTFAVTTPLVAEVLVVGGGGGGGSGGGGGGAGGLIHKTVMLFPGEYKLCVGAGGSGSTANDDTQTSGEDSFFTFDLGGSNEGDIARALGGGRGGGGGYGSSAGSGGSGGGGGAKGNNTSCALAGGRGTDGQGYAGGTGYNSLGGGGGGAGGAGTTANKVDDVTTYGDGGPGVQIDISGTPAWYAAGGGGSGSSSGGSGIGGNGGMHWVTAGTAGAANTGSGGGAGGGLYNNANSRSAGGAGGSGIIIIKHRKALHGFVGLVK